MAETIKPTTGKPKKRKNRAEVEIRLQTGAKAMQKELWNKDFASYCRLPLWYLQYGLKLNQTPTDDQDFQPDWTTEALVEVTATGEYSITLPKPE